MRERVRPFGVDGQPFGAAIAVKLDRCPAAQNGFSQRTCLPASSALIVHSACIEIGSAT
jgi:hypothetical protein